MVDTQHAHDLLRGGLQNLIAKLDNPNALLSKQPPGIDYVAFRRDMGEARILLQELHDSPLERFPGSTVESWRGRVVELDEYIGALKGYESGGKEVPQLVQEMGALAENFRSHYAALLQRVAPHIALHKLRGFDLDDHKKAFDRVVQDFNTRSGATIKKVQDEQETVDGLVQKLTEERTQMTVANHAKHFETEAESYQKQYRWWLAAAISFGLVTLAFVSYLLFRFDPGSEDTGVVLAYSIPRVLFISLLSTGIAASLRGYNANRHNYVVNRHRMRALSTFDAFVNSSQEPDVRNAVLLQTASAIFAPQASGFSKVDHEIRFSHPAMDLLKSARRE